MINIEEVLKEYGFTTETYEQLLKDCGNKVSKLNDMDWSEINDKYGLKWNGDTSRKAQQPSLLGGAFVREYYLWKQAQSSCSDDQLKELKESKLELEKLKVQFRDERTEFNKAIREQARKESYLDMIRREICSSVEPMQFDVHECESKNSDNDLIVHLTDLHTGIEIHNFANDFDENILKERIERYTSEIIKIGDRHNSGKCNIILSEVVSGLIHTTLRIENNMNMMQQFKYVCILISNMLAVLSEHFEDVNVYTCPGNHSRITANKDDSIDGENMDLLLPFYLKASMQNVRNVNIFENEIEEEIAMFNVRGNVVMSSHGHKDKPKNVVQDFTMMFSVKPDLVYLGHMHTNAMITVFDTKVIQSGCCSGTDNYAVSIRKRNRPEQTISVVDESGLVCLYDIQLD